MKMLVVLVALMIMIRLSGQGTENSLLNPASPDKPNATRGMDRYCSCI